MVPTYIFHMILRVTIVFSCVLFFCCANNPTIIEEENNDPSIVGLISPWVSNNKSDQLLELWVCHHPGTEFHDKPCKEDEYPQGCFVTGDSSKFCWYLTVDDCTSDSNSQEFGWKERYCPMLQIQ